MASKHDQLQFSIEQHDWWSFVNLKNIRHMLTRNEANRIKSMKWINILNLSYEEQLIPEYGHPLSIDLVFGLYDSDLYKFSDVFVEFKTKNDLKDIGSIIRQIKKYRYTPRKFLPSHIINWELRADSYFILAHDGILNDKIIHTLLLERIIPVNVHYLKSFVAELDNKDAELENYKNIDYDLYGQNVIETYNTNYKQGVLEF